VTHAGAISCAPLSGCHWGNFYLAEGAAPPAPDEVTPVILNRVASAGYFEAMGLRLKSGRFLQPHEGREGREKDGVIVVNESLAKTLWPDGRKPVGLRMRPGTRNLGPFLTVVGVVEDVKHYGLERDARPGVYLPLARIPLSTMSFAIRTAGDPSQLAQTVRAVVAEMNPELPVYNARPMSERLQQSVAFRMTYSWMLGVFASVALLLALGGSYGVTSYLVSQRTRELGIRVALGARRADISRAVIKGSLAVVSIGVTIGIVGAIGAGRYLSSLLFGVPPYDAAILAIAAVALFATGLFANWLPARRAAQVDPMVSLRTD